MTSPHEQRLYLEDLHPGRRFSSATYQMDAARMKAFAAEFDPQPFHVDEAAARTSFFHGLAASGWHTAAAAMRLFVESVPIANGIIGLGGEVEWMKPVRAGDTLRVESEVIEIRPSHSKPNQAIVKMKSTTLNQHNEPVQTLIAKLLVFKRDAAP
jgi:acyl dehydratase